MVPAKVREVPFVMREVETLDHLKANIRDAWMLVPSDAASNG